MNSAASLVGIDRDKRAARQAEVGKRLAQVAAELVTRHERLLDHRRADAAILVIMQVGTAEADRRHIQQHLVRAPLA